LNTINKCHDWLEITRILSEADKKSNAFTSREFIIDFNRMVFVLSELPVRFDNKLKMNLRTQLRNKFYNVPLATLLLTRVMFPLRVGTRVPSPKMQRKLAKPMNLYRARTFYQYIIYASEKNE